MALNTLQDPETLLGLAATKPAQGAHREHLLAMNQHETIWNHNTDEGCWDPEDYAIWECIWSFFESSITLEGMQELHGVVVR